MTTPKGKKSPKPKQTSQKATAAARRKRFIEALLSNGENISQAALAAGFSPKSAASQGSRLLKHAEVQHALNIRRTEVLEKFQITTERTLQELARLAYSDVRRLYHPDGRMKAIHELDDDAAAAIASMEVDEINSEGDVVGVTRKLKIWDKNSALDRAMKHLGLYEKDNVQPNAAIADAMDDANRIAKTRAAFDKHLGRSKE